MQVSELIDLVALMSFGRNQPTVKERSLYLRFLNLANLEMWQIAVNANQFFQSRDIFFAAGETGAELLLDEYYYPKAFFNQAQQLTRCELGEIFNIPVNKYNILEDKIYVNTTNLAAKADPSDNVAKKYMTTLIVPNPKTLVEEVSDAETEASTPVYPKPYHLGLVHGALFYLYTSNKGFFEKLKYQMSNWDEAKKSLRGFYS